jgi:hypothetical protein
MASIVLKNFVTTNGQVWLSIPDEQRGQIKQALFSMLACPDEKRLKSVCTAVAAFAAIEVPAKKWPEFLQTMFGAQSSDQHKFAALLCIEYFASFLDTIGAQIESTEVDQILGATVHNMSCPDPRISKMAVKALNYVLPHAALNFAQPDQR